jgi:colicin import membrane protein
MNYDAYGNPIKPPRGSGALLPLLFALFLSAGGNYWLWKERAKAVSESHTATAKVMALEAMQKEMTERLATLEAERAGLIEAKEQAVKDAQTNATELAKLKDDVAGVEVENEPDGAAPADDKTKADGKSKTDAKTTKADKKAEAKAEAKAAEAKAEAKAKAKAKAKKKTAETSSRKKDSGAEKPSSVDREL